MDLFSMMIIVFNQLMTIFYQLAPIGYINRASSYGGGSLFLEESSDCGVSGADGATGRDGLLILAGVLDRLLILVGVLGGLLILARVLEGLLILVGVGV